jgi:hypothetical protein
VKITLCIVLSNAGLTGVTSVFVGYAAVSGAEAAQVSYSSLKEKLSSSDAGSRIAARRFLGENFNLYQNDAIADLFSKRDNTDYTVSLLHGLIAGIDNATGGKLAPGQARDLSVHLPYVSNSQLNDIVAMTGDSREEVRKQALRLVERFPVDDLKNIYDQIDSHPEKDCAALSDSDQLVRWGAIFFYYNRIVQFMYDSAALTGESRAKIDALTNTGLNGAQCLSKERKVDAAALYFAGAVIFDHLKEPQSVVLAEINKFNSYLKRFGGPDQYYSQSHLDAIHDMLVKYMQGGTK